MAEARSFEVHFLLRGTPAGLSFNPALPEGMRFVDPASSIEIMMEAAYPERDEFRPLICRAYVSANATPDAYRFISALIDGRFEPYDGMPISLPYVKRGDTLIDASGIIAKGFGVPFEMY